MRVRKASACTFGHDQGVSECATAVLLVAREGLPEGDRPHGFCQVRGCPSRVQQKVADDFQSARRKPGLVMNTVSIHEFEAEF